LRSTREQAEAIRIPLPLSPATAIQGLRQQRERPARARGRHRGVVICARPRGAPWDEAGVDGL